MAGGSEGDASVWPASSEDLWIMAPQRVPCVYICILTVNFIKMLLVMVEEY